MISVAPNAIMPRLRYANYIEVGAGCYWGFRTIPDFELILVVKGAFEYQTGDRIHLLAEHDILCIPPDTEHKLTTLDRPGLISCIHFDLLKEDHLLSEVCTPEPYPSLVTKTDNPELFHQLFRQIAQDFQRVASGSRQSLCQFFKALWVKLSEYWMSNTAPRLSVKMQGMLDYIKHNAPNKVNRNVLAEHFGYSPEYINYLFKAQLGLIPTQIINREKIFTAFEMIQRRQGSLAQIAEKLGFYDQYHFSKVFKQIIGKSPVHYRKKH
jgi:AraC-like DNA-binding protein